MFPYKELELRLGWLTPLSTLFIVILWQSALLMKETGVPGEKPLTYHKSLKTLSHNVAMSWIRTHTH